MKLSLGLTALIGLFLKPNDAAVTPQMATALANLANKYMDTKTFQTQDQARAWVLGQGLNFAQQAMGARDPDLKNKNRPIALVITNGMMQGDLKYADMDVDSGRMRSNDMNVLKPGQTGVWTFANRDASFGTGAIGAMKFISDNIPGHKYYWNICFSHPFWGGFKGNAFGSTSAPRDIYHCWDRLNNNNPQHNSWLSTAWNVNSAVPVYSLVLYSPYEPEPHPGKCGSCYGAEVHNGQCCNTCGEVRKAYESINWLFDSNKIDQCKKCGSCHGAEVYNGQCCNTCQAVRKAYKSKNWRFDSNKIDQCRRRRRRNVNKAKTF